MLLCCFIDLDTESKQDLVYADIRLPVVTASSDDHREQSTLRHSWHRIECYIILRASTYGPSALCLLLEKITNGVAVRACELISYKILTVGEFSLQKLALKPSSKLYSSCSSLISGSWVSVYSPPTKSGYQ